jgi:hypothetical protein
LKCLGFLEALREAAGRRLYSLVSFRLQACSGSPLRVIGGPLAWPTAMRLDGRRQRTGSDTPTPWAGKSLAEERIRRPARMRPAGRFWEVLFLGRAGFGGDPDIRRVLLETGVCRNARPINPMDPAPPPTSSTTPDRDQASLSEELLKLAGTPESERLERLLGDRDLVLELSLAGYVGRPWDQFANRLAGYGFGVLGTWIRNRKIFWQCARKGIRLRTERDIPDDEAEQLAISTVAEAINKFRDKVLVPGKWDHTKGASLQTFFIGQCVLQFPNVYRAWLRDTAPAPPNFIQQVDLSDVGEDPGRRLDDQRRIASVSQDIVEMAAGECMGYTHDEIARRLNTTTRSVESKLWRAKRKLTSAANGGSPI